MKAAQIGRRATKNRQPVKHSKTFSGCWTCRSRHVKCSEERPACGRCLKGGFECKGYGIRLVWDSEGQNREQNIRRVIGTPAVYDDDSDFKRVDVQDALDEIDRLSTEGKCSSAGPFSVFSVPRRVRDDREACVETRPLPLALQDERLAAMTVDMESPDDITETIVSPSITNTSPVIRNKHPELWSPSTLSSSERYPWPYSPSPTLSTSHLDLLPRPAEQRALIHHWTNFVAWHIVPVDREDNPFRSVFTPMALTGLTSPSNTSNGQVALFHALCATSAFSRGQLLNNEAQMQTLAMKHYNLAIMHLRHSLASLKDKESFHQLDLQRSSILATITMFSAMDMITGRASEWRTHLQGGASWLSTIEDSSWSRDKSSSMVYQGYLAIAALCNINLPSTIDVESEHFLGDARHYVLDRFFGLTRPILKHIVQMNSLVKRISIGSTSLSAQDLDELEAQLYLQNPEFLDLSCQQDHAPLAHKLTLHHAYVFYYASLIHFHRTLRRLPPTATKVQYLVSTAMQHLEDIEALGGENIGCTLVWPPFIVACECVDEETQERMLRWYVCKRRHGFRNLEMSKDIAMEVWRRRRDDEVADVQWQDVLREMKMDIVLA